MTSSLKCDAVHNCVEVLCVVPEVVPPFGQFRVWTSTKDSITNKPRELQGSVLLSDVKDVHLQIKVFKRPQSITY